MIREILLPKRFIILKEGENMANLKSKSDWVWELIANLFVASLLFGFIYMVAINPFVMVSREAEAKEQTIKEYVDKRINEDYIIIKDNNSHYRIESDHHKMVIVVENKGILLDTVYKVVDFYPQGGLTGLQQKIALAVKEKYHLDLSEEELHQSVVQERDPTTSFESKLLYDVEIQEKKYLVEMNFNNEITNVISQS